MMVNLFSLKGSTFERVIMRFVDMLSPHLYETIAENQAEHYSMTEMLKEKFPLKQFSFLRYATDDTFQKRNRPSENMQEGNKYFWGKHKLYSYKIEVSALKIGLTLVCTEHFQASVSDLEIFKENKDFQEANFTKARSEMELTGLSLLAGHQPTQWAVLADKGYQGGT